MNISGVRSFDCLPHFQFHQFRYDLSLEPVLHSLFFVLSLGIFSGNPLLFFISQWKLKSTWNFSSSCTFHFPWNAIGLQMVSSNLRKRSYGCFSCKQNRHLYYFVWGRFGFCCSGFVAPGARGSAFSKGTATESCLVERGVVQIPVLRKN